ncbi:MAG: excinuclease ABC subunit UvrA [Acidobacteriota bacterium]
MPPTTSAPPLPPPATDRSSDADASRTSHRAIEVVGARTHNLKGVSCRVPHGQVTVVTGLSGAGKSSLAFDTIYAEAQRRYVESMSTYARQFLEQMERPPIDAMHGILPAVALEARNSIKNARSTVGTITEIHDLLRALFTHRGEVHCPNGHGPVHRWVPDQVAEDLAGGAAGARFLLVAPIPRPKRGGTGKLRELVRQGYFRRLESHDLDEDAGDDAAQPTIVRMEGDVRWERGLDPVPLVLGRFRAGGEPSARLIESIEEAFRLTDGRLTVLRVDDDTDSGGDGTPARVRYYGREMTCSTCGTVQRPPTPALFSFNSPLGACPTCQGFGRVIGIDPARVVPDPTKSLHERPFAPWNTPAYEGRYDKLYAACKTRGVALDVPWEDLPAADRDWIWSSGGRGVPTMQKFFDWLERRSYRMHVRVLLARYRAYNACPTCGGQRLRPEALAVKLADRSIADLTQDSLETLRTWLRERPWRADASDPEPAIALLLEQLDRRLATLERVGLGYLTLDRQARTLSGGETQRIQLASSLGSGLTSTLYVLDEPTIGLHPQDADRLLALLKDLATQGNTVLVVEHDRTLILGADHLIDLGPKAGEHGGTVMAEGTPAEVLRVRDSLTARYLRARPTTLARQHMARFRREQGRAPLGQLLARRSRVRIRNATAHNLRGIDVELPLGALVAVTGVSGSGKSTLIENVLYGTYQRSQGVVDVEPGDCDALEGLERIADVTLVDQQPLGRSSRSNPITYIKAYDEIRKLYAATSMAQRRGITAGHFSFNLDLGRCPTCKGTCTIEVDMQFMAPVTITCDDCHGRRFTPDVLAVTLHGKRIDEMLELTVDEALTLFADQRRLCRRLTALADVGLGYLRLGQATSTLSGGEAQRLKLASFLDRPAREAERLFLFDEPTTGLHLADIDLLYNTLRRLVQRGDGVVVVEHSLDLISRTDWVVDLGPGGGVHGGQLLFSGPLDEFLDTCESPTAVALRQHMKWRRRFHRPGPAAADAEA